MSGRYNGMQAHIKNHNPLAMLIPCAAHSLNLVGQYAVESKLVIILTNINTNYILKNS